MAKKSEVKAAKDRPKIDLSSLTGREVDVIRDDLVREVFKRAKLVAGDPHSSHSNVHSSNNSAGAI